MSIPRLMIAASASGSGKTSVSLAIIEALRRRGLDLRPFKAGPDYLDTALLSAAAGRPARNLDRRLMGARGMRDSFQRATCGGGLALIEGVMGYYDGEPASSADLAAALEVPVILSLDARAAAESAAATALGFLRYRRASRIAGFIANRVSSERHYELLRRAVEARTGLPVLGFLPLNENLALPSRHLGLVAPEGNDNFSLVLTRLGDAAERCLDLERIVAVAEQALSKHAAKRAVSKDEAAIDKAPGLETPKSRTDGGSPIIAVARDEAFSFYYEDNLDMLRRFGAQLRFFSPLRDSALPPKSAALYLGGGYPELHLSRLAGNDAMLASLRAAHACSMPIYAECGGYLYLLESIESPDGEPYSCLGIVRGRARKLPRLAGLGYREGRTLSRSPIGAAGTVIRGHVFHYYAADTEAKTAAVELCRAGGDERRTEGCASDSLFASFLHLHFAGNPAVARALVAAARVYARRRPSARKEMP